MSDQASPRRPRPRPGSEPAEEALLALLRTNDRVRTRMTAVLAPHGLSVPQYNVLRILRGARGESLPTLEIASRMIERSPGITRLLDRLHAKGLVHRERCTEDRRQVLCSITDTGLELLAGLDEPVLEADREVFSNLSDAELRRLVELLDRVRESVARRG